MYVLILASFARTVVLANAIFKALHYLAVQNTHASTPARAHDGDVVE